MQFEKGKQVTVISGGPVMTMEALGAARGTAVCIWFEGSKLMRETFDMETLKEYREHSYEPEDDEFEGRGRSSVTGY